MGRWIKRIVLGLILVAIVAVLTWAMWPKPVPVEVAAIGRAPLIVTVVPPALEPLVGDIEVKVGLEAATGRESCPSMMRHISSIRVAS